MSQDYLFELNEHPLLGSGRALIQEGVLIKKFSSKRGALSRGALILRNTILLQMKLSAQICNHLLRLHLTISMRGMRATGKIQRNSYHHGICGPSLTGRALSVSLIFRHQTHQNIKNRSVRSRLNISMCPVGEDQRHR